MFSIYVITNIVNQKRYIGYSKNTIENRFKKHINQALCKSTRSLLHAAIRKYGPESFSVESLEKCQTLVEAKTLEYFNIQLYETNFFRHGLGYNMTDGGEGCSGFRMTTEQKRKISIANRGRKWTLEARSWFSERMKGANNHRYGKRLTDSHKLALREAAAAGKTRNLKTWILINTITGERIISSDIKKECAFRGWSSANLYSAHYTKSLFRRVWQVEVIQP